MLMIMIAQTVIAPITAILTQDNNARVHGYGSNSGRRAIIEFQAQGSGMEIAGIMQAVGAGLRVGIRKLRREGQQLVRMA